MSDSPILLLFDIDGTLISSGGKGRKAMLKAAGEEFGVPVDADFKLFAGSTDPMIIRNLASNYQQQHSDHDDMISRIIEKYLHYLEIEFQSQNPATIHPGVRELVTRAGTDDRFTVGLVTGNIEQGARIKLRPVSLNSFFSFGAFGSDQADRNLLPPIARQRAEALTGRIFEPDKIWIIGDTPRDITCGKVNGYRTLAVATGGWDVAALRAHQPDAALPTLSDTRTVLDLFNETGRQ